MAGGRRAAGALAEPRRLMRTGLGLIVLGHGSLVLGAIVHGSVLRHVAGAHRAVTPEYAAANVVSVCSGLLSIAAGIVAILVSHNLSRAVLVSAGLRPSRRGGLGAALPRRQPLPWTLAPRAPSASAAAAGAAGAACPRLGPAGRSGRAGAPSWARSAPVGEAAAGSGVPRGLAGWADTGRGAPGSAGGSRHAWGSPRSPSQRASSGTELTGGGGMRKVREPHPRAWLSRPGRGERSSVPLGGAALRRHRCPARAFPRAPAIPLPFLPPAALDPAGRLSAELPAVHRVQRGAGAGLRPHGAQPGHAPGPGLQQLRAAPGCPCSHCDQRLSLQHHAHLLSAECVQPAWCSAHVPVTPCPAGHSPGPLVLLPAAGSCGSRALGQELLGGSGLPGHRALCTQLWQRAAGQAKYSNGEATP